MNKKLFGNLLKISLPLFLFVYSSGTVLADSCAELSPVVDAFYEASKNESLDAYMALIDTDYVRENLLDNYEEYVQSAWDVYDTKSYSVEYYNCKIEGTSALVYLNLDTTLVSDGTEQQVRRNYVGLLEKIGTWKIRYVLDEDVFTQFQTSLHSQLFLDATKDIIINEIDNAEALIEQEQFEQSLEGQGYEDTVSEGSSNNSQSQNDSSTLWFIIGFVLLLLAGGFVVWKRKH